MTNPPMSTLFEHVETRLQSSINTSLIRLNHTPPTLQRRIRTPNCENMDQIQKIPTDLLNNQHPLKAQGLHFTNEHYPSTSTCHQLPFRWMIPSPSDWRLRRAATTAATAAMYAALTASCQRCQETALSCPLQTLAVWAWPTIGGFDRTRPL